MNGGTALLVIDAQVNMFDPSHPVNGADALLERLTQLVARSREASVPTIFVRNCGGDADPDKHGTPGWELHPTLQPAPGDLVFDKTTCDTFGSTPLDGELETRGVTRLVIAGLQSEYCIRDTTHGALSRDYEVTLVSDGHSTYDGTGQSAQEISAGVNVEMKGRAKLLRADEVTFSRAGGWGGP